MATEHGAMLHRAGGNFASKKVQLSEHGAMLHRADGHFSSKKIQLSEHGAMLRRAGVSLTGRETPSGGGSLENP